MELENKPGPRGLERMQEEEHISKKKAKLLYGGRPDRIEVGTYAGLRGSERFTVRTKNGVTEITPFALKSSGFK